MTAPRAVVATGRAPWAALLPAALLAALLGVGCAPSRHDELAFHRSDATAALGLPFSDAVRAGELVFVSGQVGNLPGTLELVPGGIGPESRQALANMRAALRAAGSDLDRVVKVTVFLADIAEWPAFNAVYVEVFGDHLPARSAVAGSGLALGARVEVECIALAGGAR